jgi:hypothetical protein
MRTQRQQTTVINGDARHDARLQRENPPQGSITRRGRWMDLQVDVSHRDTSLEEQTTDNEPSE